MNTADPMQQFVDHVVAAGELAKLPDVVATLGDETRLELIYLLASLHARFPARMPGAQRDLLS